MLDVPAIKSLQLRNLLSFGGTSTSLRLQPLNVLIGPNASGKSNFIEALGLLQQAPRELAVPVREGGGIQDWLWKGGGGSTPIASIEAVVAYRRDRPDLRYRLSFTSVGQRLEVTDERIENAKPDPGHSRPYFYFSYEQGRPMLNVAGVRRELRREDIDPQQSVLSQRKDPDSYPEVTHIGRLFESFRLYREWNFGRYTPPRIPQPADLPNDLLSEDARNLGLVLNYLRQDASVRRSLLTNLKKFAQDAEDIDVSVKGGTVQVFLHEKSATIPATRLSDGTLRWISLLAILLHPSPPPVVCIEEPELGLHPDLMPRLAELLRDASQRMQLVVTTHSDTLVDALTEWPDSVVVCEKVNGATEMKRLDPAELKVWLEKYSLGQLWRKGEVGGNPN